MKTKAPALRQSDVPQFGTIQGGILTGWDYTVTAIGVDDGEAVVSVLAHAPGWPFPPPKPTQLRNKDFRELKYSPVAGNMHRVYPHVHDARKKVEAAIGLAGGGEISE